MLFPILIGAFAGADIATEGESTAKIEAKVESFFSSEPAQVESCEVVPSVRNGDVMICLQTDGSYIVRDI